jgi:type II secretory pathway pseudopilin PulG
MRRLHNQRGMTLISKLIAVAMIAILLALLFPLLRTVKQKVDEAEVREKMVLAAAKISAMRQTEGQYPLSLDEVDPWFAKSGLNWRYKVGSVTTGAPKPMKVRWQFFLDQVNWEETPIMLCTSLFHPDDVAEITPQGYPSFKPGVEPRFLGVTLSGRVDYFSLMDQFERDLRQFLTEEFPNDPPVSGDE